MTAPEESAVQFRQQLEAITQVARTIKSNRNAGKLMAADKERRPQLEQMLANLDAWHPALVTAAREVGDARQIMRKSLRRPLLGLRA